MLVTGAAGFLGSHISEALVADGHTVVGLDCLTPDYGLEQKRLNIEGLNKNSSFSFVEEDLFTCDLKAIGRFDYVFHLAARAGARESWDVDFREYLLANVYVVQRLLEHSRESRPRRFVYASSSSVYGDSSGNPVREDDIARPLSPYGVTKLAAETLCFLYWKEFGVPFISLRYFTLYGPRQRPDMAFHRFIDAGLRGNPIQIFGDGRQTRDFTYIDDAVRASLSALELGQCGKAYNIGGGSRASIIRGLEMIERSLGVRIPRKLHERRKGEPLHTFADITLARWELCFEPSVPLEEGIRQQVNWHREFLKSVGADEKGCRT